MDKNDIELKSFDNVSDGERLSVYDNENRLLHDPRYLTESEAASEAEADVDRPLLGGAAAIPAQHLNGAENVAKKKHVRIHEDYGGGGTIAEEHDLLNATVNNNLSGDEAETNLGHENPAEDAGENENGTVNIIRDEQSSILARIAKALIVVTICVAVLALILIVLPNCIFRLEYNELALTRNELTGSVNYDTVYGPGLHFILPWYEGILFEKTAQSYFVKELNIFTTNKLSVTTSFTMYYFLEKNKLGELYKKFGLDFKPIIESVAKTILLNHGSEFSIDDYRTKRIDIRKKLREKLRSKLEKEYCIKILDIYLGQISFTKEINRLNLLRMLNGIYNEKALYDKQTNVIRAETAVKRNVLQNEANFSIAAANAKASNEIQKIEEINKYSKLELVHLSGLNTSLSQLNFYQTRTKSDIQKTISFCYFSSLINNDKVRFIQRTSNTGIIGHYLGDINNNIKFEL